jgi:hypothetical protein
MVCVRRTLMPGGHSVLQCLLLVLQIAVISACGLVPGDVTSPGREPTAARQEVLLLSEATARLQKYLEATAVTAVVQAQEEGAFMCGAYPRSRVIWSIRVTEPPLAPDDPRLDDIALVAYCLRPGWVRFRVPERADSGTTLIMYTIPEIEELLTKKGHCDESLNL